MACRLRYRNWLASAAVLAALALPGCAPFFGKPEPPRLTEVQQQLYQVKDWKMEGRVAVKYADEGWNANLFWEHEGRQDRLRIAGPFNQGAVSIIVQDDLVYINEGNGITSSSREPERLLEQKLGFSVPLKSLRYWVLGLPDPSADFRLAKAGDGGLQGFEQNAWVLGFDRYQTIANFMIPQKMTVQGKSVSLKLVIDDWALKQ